MIEHVLGFWAPIIFGIGVFHQNSLSNVSFITNIIPGSYHKNRKCRCFMAHSTWIISKIMFIMISIECALDVCNCHNDWKLNPTTISEPCVGWWNNAVSWSRRDGMDSTVIFTFLFILFITCFLVVCSTQYTLPQEANAWNLIHVSPNSNNMGAVNVEEYCKKIAMKNV